MDVGTAALILEMISLEQLVRINILKTRVKRHLVLGTYDDFNNQQATDVCVNDISPQFGDVSVIAIYQDI